MGKAFAAKLEGPNSVPGTSIVEEENLLPQAVFRLREKLGHVCTYKGIFLSPRSYILSSKPHDDLILKRSAYIGMSLAHAGPRFPFCSPFGVARSRNQHLGLIVAVFDELCDRGDSELHSRLGFLLCKMSTDTYQRPLQQCSDRRQSWTVGAILSDVVIRERPGQ